MILSSRLERLLSLRPGDIGRGGLLFLYYFLVIAGYVMSQVARDALFLDRFDAAQLPYPDIVIALFVGLVVAGYLRLAEKLPLGPLVVGSLIFFGGTAVLFWLGFTTAAWSWLFPAFYIWVGLFGVLAITQIWTLANFMLTTREAKRVFGLIGSGGILGGIFGGFIAGRLATAFGTASLLLALGAVMAACSVIVLVIWRSVEEDHQRPVAEGERQAWSLRDSARLVADSRHLRTIAVLICVGSVVTTVAGWQFKAIAKASYQDTDALAVFFSNFVTYTGLLAFGTQVVVTSRVLQRFGIGVALMALPVALTLATGGVLIWGNLLAVGLLRGSDKVLRYSVDTASLQLLYLPVPSEIKVQVKSFIDMVVWRFGDGLAAVSVLVFATWMGLTPEQIGWVSLMFLALWLAVARQAHREYLQTLSDRLERHRVDQDPIVPVLDRSTTSVLARTFSSGSTDEILHGLALFETGYHQTAHPAMPGLIHHEAAEVRAKALSLLSVAREDAVSQAEVHSLLDDPDPGVRVEALSYLTRRKKLDPLQLVDDAGGFPEPAIRTAVVGFLARTGPHQNADAARLILDRMLSDDGPNRRALRLEAARMIGATPDVFFSEMEQLLFDPETEVVRQALDAMGPGTHPQLVPKLISCLGDPDLRSSASRALSCGGASTVEALDSYFGDDSVPMDIRLSIPEILLKMGTSEAGQALVENLLQPNAELRFRVMSALDKLLQSDPGIPLDRPRLETVLVAELLGHHRSYQAYDTLASRLDVNDPSLAAFRDSLNREIERIFLLLGLLYPGRAIEAVRLGLSSHDARLHDDALEFVESLLNPDLRALLVPLVDRSVSIRERNERATRLVGQAVRTSEEAIRMLISSGDPWLKSCAAYAIGRLGLIQLGPELDRISVGAGPLLMESIQQARALLAAASRANQYPEGSDPGSLS